MRRLHALELLSIDWETAVSQVQNHGLARINDAVQPLIDGLRGDLATLIAQGREDLAAQATAVDAKLAEVDATMVSITAVIAAIEAKIMKIPAATPDDAGKVMSVSTAGALVLQRLPETPPADPEQLEYLIW